MRNKQNSTNVHFQLKDVDYNIPYEQQSECRRHVIGAYANLARHNMTLVINTIMQAVGMDTYDEDDIGDAFGPGHLKKLAKLDNIQKVNLQKRLYRHFSFLKRMKLEDKEKKQYNCSLFIMCFLILLHVCLTYVISTHIIGHITLQKKKRNSWGLR